MARFYPEVRVPVEDGGTRQGVALFLLPQEHEALTVALTKVLEVGIGELAAEDGPLAEVLRVLTEKG